MLPLHGVGVLVTRPQQQAMPLCRLLETEGASTFRLPAIEITALSDRRTLAARLGPLANFELIIFSSANAVRFGAVLLEQKRDLTLAAIGSATARALNQAGYRVAVQPADGKADGRAEADRAAAARGRDRPAAVGALADGRAGSAVRDRFPTRRAAVGPE